MLEVEKNAECRKVIEQRMAEHLADRAPVHDDICSFVPDEPVDGYVAGFPCQAQLFYISFSLKLNDPGQGVSHAGCQGGLSDDRTGLIREVFRVWDQQNPKPKLDLRWNFRRHISNHDLWFLLYVKSFLDKLLNYTFLHFIRPKYIHPKNMFRFGVQTSLFNNAVWKCHCSN